MFGGDKVWRIALSKAVGEKKFGEYLKHVIITCTVHMRDCMCNHEAGTRMSSFIIDSVIRGHHFYKAIWEPVNGEELNTERETGNPHDPLAMAVTKLLRYMKIPTFSD